MKLSEISLLAESEARKALLVKKYDKKIQEFLKTPDVEKWIRHSFDIKHTPGTAEIIKILSMDIEMLGVEEYLEWTIRQFLKDKRVIEDIGSIVDDLATFKHGKNKLPSSERDINKYDRRALRLKTQEIDSAEHKSNREIKKEEIAKLKTQIDTIYEGSKGRCYVPKTKEASCFLGRGTKWCTAATQSANYFKTYNDEGPLYVLILPNGDKYQYWCPDDSPRTTVYEEIQLMDPLDHQVHNPNAVHGLLDLMIEAAKSGSKPAFDFIPFFLPWIGHDSHNSNRITEGDFLKIYDRLSILEKNKLEAAANYAMKDDNNDFDERHEDIRNRFYVASLRNLVTFFGL